MPLEPIEINRLAHEVLQRLGLTEPATEKLELIRALLNHLGAQPAVQVDDRLSPREKVCLQLLAQGHHLEQIADELHIKRTTVATFIKRIKKKLSCETLAQAVFEGMRDSARGR